MMEKTMLSHAFKSIRNIKIKKSIQMFHLRAAEPLRQLSHRSCIAYFCLAFMYKNVITFKEIFLALKAFTKTKKWTRKDQPKRRQWRRFGVFIVNFEHISHLCSCLSIVNFEHVIAGWDVFLLIAIISKVLSKVKQDQDESIFAAFYWLNQVWFMFW